MDYFDWINQALIPPFVRFTQEAMHKGYYYDLGLAEGAARHSKHLMEAWSMGHAPPHLLDGAVENVIQALSIGCNYEDTLKWAAYALTEDEEHYANLRDNNRLGVGIALRNNVMFITQRLKR